jgi:hypothetical protein
VEFREAAIKILDEESRSLHWTVIQDLALKRGYLDPFEQRNIREGLLSALRDLTREGAIRRLGKGVYESALEQS